MPAKEPEKRTVAFSRNARNVFLHILTACNLKCAHCYINPEEHGRGRASLEEIKGWLKTLAHPDKPTNVVFLGGEPTMHPDLPAAVREAKRLGYASVTVDTNGYLFHDFLDKVTPADVDFISFSLDGATPGTNDAQRGQGCFATVVGSIKKAVERGFSVSVIYTVTSRNIHELPRMPKLLKGLGVSRFFIQVIGIRGKAAEGEELQLSADEWRKKVAPVAEEAARLGMIATYPKVFLAPGESFECAGNVAENLFVFPNGRVYSCPLCEDYPVHAAEISEAGLTERPGLTEKRFFSLNIPEGCVMNRLIQPGNIEYGPDGAPLYAIACCLLKEEVRPAG
ncbi:MAG: radical SAM protein [Deltaproteobacteria bacterium]|nr:radical SAM protein [Deltaproteobacteria bacterium]